MSGNIVAKAKERYYEHERQQKKIIDTAIRLFNAKGYVATTTAEIAKEADIYEATMYKYFRSKKDLFLASFEAICEELTAAYREIYQKYPDDEIGYLKGVTLFYKNYVFNDASRSMFLVHLLGYREDPDFESAFRNFMERSIDAIEKVIQSAKNKGKIKSKLSARVLAAFYVNQYFTVLALKDFIDPHDITDEVMIELIGSMLQMED